MAGMSGVQGDNEDVLPVVDRGAAGDGSEVAANDGVGCLEDLEHVDAPNDYQESHPEQPQEEPQEQSQEQAQEQPQEQPQLRMPDFQQLEVPESSFTGTFQALLRKSKQIPEYTSGHYQHWKKMKADLRHEQRDSLQKVNQQGHNDRLTLHIGGTRFETSRQTLCVDADSMLAAWVLRHLNEGDTMMWLDRDGNRFGHVLNYLRSGTIFLQDVPSLRAVQEEAAFFGLSGLQALCEERIKHVEIREQDKMRKKEEYQETVIELLRALLNGGTCPHSKARPTSLSRGRTRTRDDPIFDTTADF